MFETLFNCFQLSFG